METNLVAPLENMLKEEDVLATMLVRRGFEGAMPAQELFKLKDLGIWQTLQITMDKFLNVVEKFASAGLNKIYFELGEYEVVFFVLRGDAALVAVVPKLCNKGLLEVTMENARQALLKELRLAEA